MKWLLVLTASTLACIPGAIQANQESAQPGAMEAPGDAAGTRSALARAVEASPNNVAALTRYAEFLQRYGDPSCREVYGKLLTALQRSGDTARAAVISKRIEILDLLSGGRAGGSDRPAAASNWPTAPIPGPLRSFARMAAISGDSRPEDILPALARNVVTNGYQASHSNEALEQTEYLKLVHRYLSQAGGDGETGRRGQDHHHRYLRIAACGGTTARSRFPHSRRLRF